MLLPQLDAHERAYCLSSVLLRTTLVATAAKMETGVPSAQTPHSGSRSSSAASNQHVVIGTSSSVAAGRSAPAAAAAPAAATARAPVGRVETEMEQAKRIFSTRIGVDLPAYSTGSVKLLCEGIKQYKAYIAAHPEDTDAQFILDDQLRILEDM